MQTYYKIANAPHSMAIDFLVPNSIEETINYLIDLYNNIYQYEYIGETISDELQYSYYSTAAPLPKATLSHLKENAEIVPLSAEEVFYLQHNEPLYFIEEAKLIGSLLTDIFFEDSPLTYDDVQRCFIEAI